MQNNFYTNAQNNNNRYCDRGMQERVRCDRDNNDRYYNDREVDMTHCHRHDNHCWGNGDATLWILLAIALWVICECCD